MSTRPRKHPLATYHHGDLKRALLTAVEDIVRDKGIEALTLREAARRAGVSHGAPLHHFRDKRGLLTAFAVAGSRKLERCVRRALAGIDPRDHAARLTAVGMGYLDFALRHGAHFRIVFRPELLDGADPDLEQARAAAGHTLDEVLMAARDAGSLSPNDYDRVRLASWSIAHGFASLAAEGAFGPVPRAVLRERAAIAFALFSRRVLRPD